MKKIVVFLIFTLLLLGCKKTHTSYYYSGYLTKKINKKIQIDGDVKEGGSEKSYLNYISIWGKGVEKDSVKIKIIDKGREYIIDTKHKISNIYPVYKKGVRINSDSFIAELGEVKFEDGTILKLPPIKFRKYVQVIKVNPVLDALNQDTREDPFQGTIEEYREWKKRNK